MLRSPQLHSCGEADPGFGAEPRPPRPPAPPPPSLSGYATTSPAPLDSASVAAPSRKAATPGLPNQILDDTFGDCFVQGDATTEDVMQFWTDNETPLVGHRTQENQGSRFWEKPLCVVYYTVDFSPEHREGNKQDYFQYGSFHVKSIDLFH